MVAGRPRAFDTEKALDAAMKVFWKKGYEGTSLPDLTEAMGINRPSLYAAFGNKEALFRKAIERYLDLHASSVRESLDAPTAREVVERLLDRTIALITGSKNPRGCFMVQSALACGDEAECLRKELAKRRLVGEEEIAERFRRARKEGDLPAKADPSQLAKFVTTLSQGLAVQASAGASREELRAVAEIALRGWPS